MANETGQTLSQVYNTVASSPTLRDSMRIPDALWKLLSAEIRKEINKIRQESRTNTQEDIRQGRMLQAHDQLHHHGLLYDDDSTSEESDDDLRSIN